MNDDNLRHNCDTGITALARLLMESGAPGEMVLDRMLTFAGAHAVVWTGAPEAARAFRLMAERIEAGAFVKIEAEKKRAQH